MARILDIPLAEEDLVAAAQALDDLIDDRVESLAANAMRLPELHVDEGNGLQHIPDLTHFEMNHDDIKFLLYYYNHQMVIEKDFGTKNERKPQHLLSFMIAFQHLCHMRKTATTDPIGSTNPGRN